MLKRSILHLVESILILVVLMAVASFYSTANAQVLTCQVDSFGKVTDYCPDGYAARPICDLSGQAGLCTDCQCEKTDDPNIKELPAIDYTDPNAKTSGATSCGDTNDPEYHSLRPYPAQPCSQEKKDLALFCGNNLVLTDSITRTYPSGSASCTDIGGGKVRCNYVVDQSKNIAIDLSGAEFPIMGLTQTGDVVNSESQPSPEPVDNNEKVNEYVSWYLNGITGRAEYPPLDLEDPEEIRKIVEYSGPLKKLLPWEVQLTERIKTIERAKDDRHDQAIGCVNLLGRITECYPERLGVREIRLSDWAKHKPPLPSDYDDFSDYWADYLSWRGKTCVNIGGILSKIPGNPFNFDLNACIQNPFKADYFANLFGYVPFSSTEDRLGEVVTSTYSIQGSGDVKITNASFDHQAADLYFAHMEEDDELARLLQGTFVYKGAPVDEVVGTGIQSFGNCDVRNVRSNPGDDLHAGEITGTLSYTAEFSCEFDKISSPTVSSYCYSLGGRCYPSNWGCGGNQYDCPSGYACARQCSAPTQSCTKDININLQVLTKTPKADSVWSRLVAGPASVFKRFFPKLGEKGPVIAALDIPGATNVTYSGEGLVRAANPGQRSGESAELYFPHIGGIHEYFLKGIQTALRPKGMGDRILSGAITRRGAATCTSGAVPDLPSIDPSCSACSKYDSLMPPTMKKIFEAAASYYKIPANVLVGVFYNEGGFGQYEWTEESVKAASGPNCEVPECDSSNVSPSGAQGPWQFIPTFWTEHANAVLDAGIDDGRTPNQCNLLDATFAAARKLAKEKSGWGGYEAPTCVGVTLNTGSSSASGCNWSDSDVITAARQYLGYCESPNPAEQNPNFPVRQQCYDNINLCYQKSILNFSKCQ